MKVKDIEIRECPVCGFMMSEKAWKQLLYKDNFCVGCKSAPFSSFVKGVYNVLSK